MKFCIYWGDIACDAIVVLASNIRVWEIVCASLSACIIYTINVHVYVHSLAWYNRVFHNIAMKWNRKKKCNQHD